MTASEIRNLRIPEQSEDKEILLFQLFREHAAQLAELNEQLEAFRASIQPLIVKFQRGIFG